MIGAVPRQLAWGSLSSVCCGRLSGAGSFPSRPGPRQCLSNTPFEGGRHVGQGLYVDSGRSPRLLIPQIGGTVRHPLRSAASTGVAIIASTVVLALPAQAMAHKTWTVRPGTGTITAALAKALQRRACVRTGSQ